MNSAAGVFASTGMGLPLPHTPAACVSYFSQLFNAGRLLAPIGMTSCKAVEALSNGTWCLASSVWCRDAGSCYLLVTALTPLKQPEAPELFPSLDTGTQSWLSCWKSGFSIGRSKLSIAKPRGHSPYCKVTQVINLSKPGRANTVPSVSFKTRSITLWRRQSMFNCLLASSHVHQRSVNLDCGLVNNHTHFTFTARFPVLVHW